MASFQFRASGPVVFYGNPNVTITSIDTSGGIMSSRTSADIPAAVQVSAANFTANSTISAFRDLHYRWNFGDTSAASVSANLMTDPVTGRTVNPNTDQFGPEAAYIYRTAGTYTITCEIVGKNGTKYTKAYKSMTFTANTFTPSNGEFWFDSNYDGSGGSPIGTFARPFTDYQTYRLKIENHNVWCHLKYGSTFTGVYPSFSYVTVGSHTRTDAYGDPSQGQPVIFWDNSSAPTFQGTLYLDATGFVGDSVWSNIKIRSGGTRTIFGLGTGGEVSHIYFDNCYMDNFEIAASSVQYPYGTGVDGFNRFGWWCCQSIQAVAPEGFANTWQLGGSSNWEFHIGCLVTCTGPGIGGDALDHWIYPAVNFHGLYRWCEFGPGNTWFGINGNHHGSASENFKWHLMADLYIHGTIAGIEMSTSTPGSENGRFGETVVERVKFRGQSQNNAITVVYAYGVTARYCDVQTGSSGYFFSVSGVSADGDYEVYCNRINDTVNGAGINFADGFTGRIQVTDNVINNTQVGANVAAVTTADAAWSVTGSIYDRNQYYVPNQTNCWSPDSGVHFNTFSQWQSAGFDLNGVILSSPPP